MVLAFIVFIKLVFEINVSTSLEKALRQNIKKNKNRFGKIRLETLCKCFHLKEVAMNECRLVVKLYLKAPPKLIIEESKYHLQERHDSVTMKKKANVLRLKTIHAV